MKQPSTVSVMVIMLSIVFMEKVCFGIQATGFMPGVENTISNAYNSVVGVWIPALSFAALVGLCLNCYFGFIRIATRAVGLLFGIFGLGAGLPWLAQLSGGTIATSFTL